MMSDVVEENVDYELVEETSDRNQRSEVSYVYRVVTTNPEWPEISAALQSGQSVYEIPAIVRSVFEARLRIYLTNLSSELNSDSVKVRQITHVIEYLKRGFPHAHILVVCEVLQRLDLLEAQPGSANSEANKQFDEFISSRKTSSMSATWVAPGVFERLTLKCN